MTGEISAPTTWPDAARQRLGQTSDPASEVEGRPARPWQLQLGEAVKQQRDFALTGLHELLQGPAAAAFVGIGQHGPERI